MIATILYRLAGEPAVSGTFGFADAADGAWYTDAITWAAANGIVNGYSSTMFGPNDAITREQTAAMLYRYAVCMGYDGTAGTDLSGYTDASESGSYAVTAMEWANAEGLITGTTDATLVPLAQASRAEVAAILMRFREHAAE